MDGQLEVLVEAAVVLALVLGLDIHFDPSTRTSKDCISHSFARCKRRSLGEHRDTIATKIFRGAVLDVPLC